MGERRDISPGIPPTRDGFGDFCLFPESIICYRFRWEIGEGRVPLIVTQTSSSNSNEQFPFLRLPRDIRDIVYGYIVKPFKLNLWWEGGVIKIDIAPIREGKCHPARTGYQMSVVPPAKYSATNVCTKGPEHKHIVSEFFTAIWHLSNVSRQVRAEIGEAFWRGVYVNAMHREDLLFNFMNDRPAAIRGIKRLRTCWTCEDNFDELDEKLVPFAERIAETLDLEGLDFHFTTTVELARDLVASEGRVAWVQAVRKIRTKGLDLQLRLTGEDPLARKQAAADIDSDDDSDGLVNKDPARQLSPLIEALLQPCKAEPELLSDEKIYLKSRANEFEPSEEGLTGSK